MLKRNEKTGKVECWENGKKVGEITTMGDDLNDKPAPRKKNRTLLLLEGNMKEWLKEG